MQQLQGGCPCWARWHGTTVHLSRDAIVCAGSSVHNIFTAKVRLTIPVARLRSKPVKDSKGRDHGSAVLVATEATINERMKLTEYMRLGLDSFIEAKCDFGHCNDPGVGLNPDE